MNYYTVDNPLSITAQTKHITLIDVEHKEFERLNVLQKQLLKQNRKTLKNVIIRIGTMLYYPRKALLTMLFFIVYMNCFAWEKKAKAIQCKGITKANQQCKRKVSADSVYCYQHKKQRK